MVMKVPPILAGSRVTEPQTLAKALMVWGDPAAVAEMTRLAKEGYDSHLLTVGRPETESDRNALRYRGLREELQTALVEKLREGSLVATGYDSRASLDAPRTTIPADRWRVLAPSFGDSSAADGGLAERNPALADCRGAEGRSR